MPTARFTVFAALVAVSVTTALLFASAASATSIHDLRYEVPATGVPGGSYFSTGIAIDNDPLSPSAGELYVASSNPIAVDKFAPGLATATYSCQITGFGSLSGHSASECDTTTAGPGGFQSLRGVTVDPTSGDLYAADPTAHRIYQFNPTGAYTGKRLDLGAASAQRLAVSAASGNVFIADETNKRILEWNPVTEATTTFATEAGSPPAGFGEACGVATDNASAGPNYGDVYVADCGKSVIDRFSEAGTYECEITGAGEASSVADECDSSEPGVAVEANFSAGRLQGLHGALAVDPSNGHLYVGEGFGFARLDEFAASGAFLATIASPHSSGGGGYAPWNLAVSAVTGDLFVASIDNPEEAFAYGPDKPLPVTGVASNVTPTSATLTATVNPLGAEVTECEFQYLDAADYQPGQIEPYAPAATAPCAESAAAIGQGEQPVAVHAELSGLEAGAVYHYRLVTANANGRSLGSDRFFGPPAVDGEGASDIGQTSARLTGLVNPDNLATSYRFEYGEANGPTDSYQHSLPVPDEAIGASAADVPVSQLLSGLQLGATYHYRLVATSSDGSAAGKDKAFSTLPAALIDAQPAASIGTTTATLHAYVNPLGAATSYHFEWATKAEVEAERYGHSTPTEPAGDGTEPTLAEVRLEGLAPGTEYHFRLLAEGSNGTVDGPDEAFTTEAASCPNETLRKENDSTALPECRAYEQVSPVEKDNAAVRPEAELRAAPDGERLAFQALGFFAGNPGTGYEYISQRGPNAWDTSSDNPPWAYFFRRARFHSADLSESLWAIPFRDAFTLPTQEALFLSHEGVFRQASPTLERLDSGDIEGSDLTAASADLSTAIIRSLYPLIPDSLPATEPHGRWVERFYELSGLRGPTPTIRLLQIAPGGAQLQNCTDNSLVLGGPGPAGQFYSIDQHGTVVFFSIDALTTGGGCNFDNQLYARRGGGATVAISEPEPNDECTTVACRGAAISGAAFAGASADGSRAYFLSSRQLTDEASEGSASAAAAGCGSRSPTSDPNGCNLYLYDFTRPAGHNLLAVSAGDSPGEGPRVQGVTRVSSDGSRIYFVAQGPLTAQPNSLGQSAQPGADNLYLYDTVSERLAFVAQLCSGEERSGSRTGVSRCFGDDSEAMWTGRSENFATPNGSVLDFVTHAQLTPDDENEAADVYRYAAATGSLARVSVGHDGFGQNGNVGGQASLDGHSMSDDGSTIVFATARPLQESDENGKVDYYEWHQGQVTLLSGAKSTSDLSKTVVTTTSGRDVFFFSDEGLVPADRDGITDLYDARVGGGFPLSPPPPSPCESNETCQGGGTHSGSSPNITHGEFPAHPLYCHKGFVKRHGKCVRKHHKRHPRRNHRHNPAHHYRGGSK